MPFTGEMMETEWNPKLYLVSCGDLPHGVQACQAMHAMREFANEHPEIERKWYKESNYIGFLQVKDDVELQVYVDAAKSNEIKHSTFCEPDLDDKLTAAAFEPTLESRELLKDLKTALRKPKKFLF